MVGRFINADAWFGANIGAATYNLYAYCGNNPISYADDTGTSPRHTARLKRNERIKARTGGSSSVHDYINKNKQQISDPIKDNAISIEDFKNQDGTYSLYDNKRNNPNNIFHEQILAFSYDCAFDLKDAMLGGGADLALITGGWEGDYVDISLLDLGKVSLYAGKSKSFVGLGAMATIWSPEVSVNILGWDIALGADIGSIGLEAGMKNGKYTFGASYGWGFHVSVVPN